MRILELILKASSEGSDEPAQMFSVSRAYFAGRHKLWN